MPQIYITKVIMGGYVKQESGFICWSYFLFKKALHNNIDIFGLSRILDVFFAHVLSER